VTAALRGLDLPDFPWDSLAPYKARAIAHPGGIVDLSVGTPVDPVPELIQKALIDAVAAVGRIAGEEQHLVGGEPGRLGIGEQSRCELFRKDRQQIG